MQNEDLPYLSIIQNYLENVNFLYNTIIWDNTELDELKLSHDKYV